MTRFKWALVVLLPSLFASFAVAQTVPAGTFKHIIIIVQENRTPDNVFGAWAGGPCAINQTPVPGADLANGRCDYWGTHSGNGLSVEPTAIFIVWDDWGGFYDHVAPYTVLTGKNNGTQQNPIWSCTEQPNQWGCGYTYGFRVPFMVASEFTGTNTSGQITNYISGACGSNGCNNNTFPYQHDFGSILAFTEHNFGLSPQFIAQPYYADYNAPDWSTDHITHVPLSDFFSLYTGTGSTGRSFMQIPSSYAPSFFESYYATYGASPSGPDTD